jgi:hypothetical protein
MTISLAASVGRALAQCCFLSHHFREGENPSTFPAPLDFHLRGNDKGVEMTLIEQYWAKARPTWL